MQSIEIPISEETFQRYKQFHEKDPNHMKPFMFRDLDNNIFLINHGTPEGLLWNEKLKRPQILSEFIKFIRQHMSETTKNSEIVLLCCHGGAIKDAAKGVIIANRSIDELFIAPPQMSCDMDDNYFIHCECSDGAFY